MVFSQNNLDGIIPPLVTPFDENEEINYKQLSDEINFHLKFNISGLIVGGSTGEGYSLSDDELSNLCEFTINKVKNKFPVIAGIITNSTRDAIRKSLLVKDKGVDGLMITPIQYFRTNDEGAFSFYNDIGKKVNLPIIVYNVVSNNPILPNVLENISNIEQIIGIKQSIGDGSNSPDGQVAVLADIINKLGSKLSILSSYDPVIFPGLVMGARGSIGAINTILPDLSVKLYESVCEGNLEKAKDIFYKMYPVSRLLKNDNWPSRVKTAINLQGRSVGIARKPMTLLNKIELKEVNNILRLSDIV
jgi:4-hydroxy-tetrahydrodipicolinate synthase